MAFSPLATNVGSTGFPGFAVDGPAVQPVSGAKLVDTFGAARSGGRSHEGIDIFADSGTPIHAIAGGTVVQGFDSSLGGIVVRIQGDDGRYYYYAHLKEGSVDHLEVGERVNAGQVIGEVGRTGNAASTPAHLHFQVRENGDWVNPFEFLQDLPTAEEVAGGAAVPGGAALVDPFAIDRGAPPSVADTDSDGLTDPFEQIFGTDPNAVDTDRDSLSDAYETATSHTDPLSADTDRDGLTDGYEVGHGTDAGRGPIPDAAREAGFGGLANLDSDADGLSDAYEGERGMDALSADSDRDGLGDAFETARGSNPLSLDTDSDGLADGFEAAAGTLGPAPQPVPGLGGPAGVPGAAPAAPVEPGAPGDDPADADYLDADTP